ncbi:MAG: ATPase [archaeon]
MATEWVIFLLGIASVLGFAGGAIGSSLGMLVSTRAGVSIISEDPQQLRNVILLAALPMTQTLYGVIFAIYLTTTVMPRAATLSVIAAGGIVGLGFVTMVAECFSAWAQGIACATGISMLSKTKGQITTSTLVLAAYTEFVGILGMVFGIAITSLMIG